MKRVRIETMWLIICWLVGLPKILYHFFLTISILIWYLCYKIFGTTSPPAFVQHQQHQEYQQNFPLQDEHRHHFSGHLRDKVKLVLMKGTMAFREKQQDQSRIDQTGNQVNQSCIGSNSRSKNNNNNTVSQSYLSSLATVLIVVLICFSKCPMQTYCREQVSIILPLAPLFLLNLLPSLPLFHIFSSIFIKVIKPNVDACGFQPSSINIKPHSSILRVYFEFIRIELANIDPIGRLNYMW